jgi:hypothetical protein
MYHFEGRIKERKKKVADANDLITRRKKKK